MNAKTLVAASVLLLALLAWGCSSSSDDGGDQPAAAELAETGFQIGSPNFSEVRPKVRIPVRNTCYGENLSPPLFWSGAPDGTQSYALVAEDIDHETGTWVHWVLYNIPGGATELPEGVATDAEVLPDGTVQGTNDERFLGYAGACPPANIISYSRGGGENYEFGEPPHRYYFRLYALDSVLELEPRATKGELLSAMDGHILAQTETFGKYTTSLGLSGKEGGGFLKTSTGQEADLEEKKGLQKSVVGGGQAQAGTTPSEEKIYNSLGDLITPTPASGQ